jgi:thiopeptide-type bacteriocin biosynthesis protein
VDVFELSPPPAGATWLQFDVGLVRVGGDARPSARAFFARALPRLEDIRRDGLIQGWFFMRKPPDIRLRVWLTANEASVFPSLDEGFRNSLNRGDIRQYSPGLYRPETARFGGPDSMDVVHAHFCADSALWAELDQLDADRTLTPDSLLPALLHDLFVRTLEPDPVEGWRRLQTRMPPWPPTPPSKEVPPPSPALDALASTPGMNAVEKEALRTYARVHERFAQRLALTTPSRPRGEVVADVALFTLNRHGFPGERSAPLVAHAIAALDAQAGRSESDGAGPGAR